MFRLCGLVLVFTSTMSLGQNLSETNAGTTLETVINSAYQHYPAILSAMTRVSEQEAERESAMGAFDTRIESNAKSRMSGYYDGDFIDGGVYQALPTWGAEVFADYGRSAGDFPIYEQEYVTASRGQARLGIALSLLRDRKIDDNRYNLNLAELEMAIAGHELEAEIITTLQSAFVSYANWLTSARLADAYDDLLQIAEDRQVGLERQVETGNISEFVLLENEQAILQRLILAQEGKRRQQIAEQKLSLFLRDLEGNLMLPVFDDSLSLPEAPERLVKQDRTALIANTLSIRPDILIMASMLEQVELARALAENDAKPKLDFSVYTARDFGNGSENLLGTDNVAALSFEYPLQNRSARGKINAATSRLRGLEMDLRLLQDEITTELNMGIIDVQARRQLLETAERETEVAASLASAEARRFEQGISDFFLLNSRENSLAQAELRRWQANLEYQVAMAILYGLTVDLTGLGLDEESLPATY